MRIVGKVVGTFVVASVLAGCVTVDVDQMLGSQTPPTAALRAELVRQARDFLYDPYSVRDAELSNVMVADATRGLTVVCVKANAKNLMGGYIGRQAMSVRMVNGMIVGALANAPICNAPALRYYAFPELEAL